MSNINIVYGAEVNATWIMNNERACINVRILARTQAKIRRYHMYQFVCGVFCASGIKGGFPVQSDLRRNTEVKKERNSRLLELSTLFR